jgi:hypothetical protein
MNRFSIILLLASAVACEEPASTPRVRLDLHELAARAAQSGVVISRIDVEVRAPDMDTVRVAVSLEDLSFELTLSAGAARTFELLAQGAEAPVYWGITVVDLPARSDVEVTIPTWPAGGVVGTLEAAVALPASLPVGFVNDAPLNGRPGRLEAPAGTSGVFTRALPTATYALAVAAVVGGTRYEPDPRRFAVTQGEIAHLGSVVLLPPGTPHIVADVPTGGLAPGRGISASSGAALESSGYRLKLGRLGAAGPTDLQSEGYRLREIAPGLERSSP